MIPLHLQSEAEASSSFLPGEQIVLEVEPPTSGCRSMADLPDMRWRVSKRQDASCSFQFDEENLNDSFNSTSTTISSSTLDEDSPPILPKRKAISFSADVKVREYDVIIGDDRVCIYPLTLSWRHKEEHIYDLDEHESDRIERRERRRGREAEDPNEVFKKDDPETTPGTRRRSFPFPRRLSADERLELLRSFGHSTAELSQNARRRKIRLALEYAYGHQQTAEAIKAFKDQDHKYII